MNEQDFLKLLEKDLMAEAPLLMDEPFPEELFDSTGKVLLLMALEELIGSELSEEVVFACQTPRDLYALVGNRQTAHPVKGNHTCTDGCF